MDRWIGRRRGLVLTSLGHFINDGTVFFVPVIAAIVATRPGMSPALITALFLVFYASTAVLSLFAGRLADRLGRPGSLMGLGLAILSVGLLLFYVALEETGGTVLVGTLLFAALLTGTGAAFYHPLGGTLLQAAFEGRRLGLALGVNGAMGSLGRALYPSLYFVTAAAIGGYGSVVVFAGVGFAAAVAIWLGTRAPGGSRRAASTEQAASGEPTRDPEPAPTLGSTRDPEPAPTLEPAPPVAAGTRSVLTRGIIVLTGVAFLRSVATQGIAAWIPTYLATQRGFGVSASLGLAVTIMYAAAVVGQPFFGLLVDRLDARWVLAFSSLGSAVSILAYLAVSGSGRAGEGWLFAFGFFTFSGFPLLLSLVSDYVPRRSTSLANALVWGVGSTAGGALGPVLVGALVGADYGRLDLAFTLAAGAAVVSAVATVLLPRPAHVARMAAFG